MNIRVSGAIRSQLSQEDAEAVEKTISSLPVETVPILVEFQVTGPAVFYQVLPYTWGRDGRSETVGGVPAMYQLSASDGVVRTIALIQKDLLNGIRIGVAWLEPYGEGLRSGAIRIDFDGQLEEWVWRNRVVGNLPCVSKGRWKRRKLPESSVGPLTQPWEVPSRIPWKRRPSPRE